jgi:hypothetical protein
MRIVIASLIAISVGLALSPPAHAETQLYLSAERLEQIAEDSKTICWLALKGPTEQIGPVLDRETAKRGYTTRDKVVLGSLCKVYLEGQVDGIRAVNHS